MLCCSGLPASSHSGSGGGQQGCVSGGPQPYSSHRQGGQDIHSSQWKSHWLVSWCWSQGVVQWSKRTRHKPVNPPITNEKRTMRYTFLFFMLNLSFLATQSISLQHCMSLMVHIYLTSLGSTTLFSSHHRHSFFFGWIDVAAFLTDNGTLFLKHIPFPLQTLVLHDSLYPQPLLQPWCTYRVIAWCISLCRNLVVQEDVVLSVSEEGMLHMWDACSAKHLLSFDSKPGTIQTANLFRTTDSCWLVTGQRNGCLHIYSID